MKQAKSPKSQANSNIPGNNYISKISFDSFLQRCIKRESILKLTITAALSLTVSLYSWGQVEKEPLIFGVCSDLHGDIMPDTKERLNQFIDQMNEEKPDFIVQLGDFFMPRPKNDLFLDIWNRFNGDSFHVIGNHETDGECTRDEVVEYLDMPGRYYSFKRKGFQFIVMDGNDSNPSGNAGYYARYIGEEQLNWLSNTLRKTKDRVVIFIHQSLINTHDGVENRDEIRNFLETYNRSGGRVVAVFAGHSHFDKVVTHGGIHYIHINSMSELPVGKGYSHIRYSEEVDRQFPTIKYVIPYRDPLYAMCRIEGDTIAITGRETSYIGLSPEELGLVLPGYYWPGIKSRVLLMTH